MPTFIANRPDIPERLLQAHEDGKVIFFCGAGISYPAKLPGFGGLVKAIYDELGTSPNEVQQAAIKAGQYDTAIGLLESDIAGLDAVVGDDARWLPKELQLCLNDIEESNEQLRADTGFTRLSDLIKRRGIT